MANAPVRELITSVKFKIDRTSLRQVERQIGNIKKAMRGLQRASATINVKAAGVQAALQAIRRVRSEMRSLNGSAANVNINTRRTTSGRDASTRGNRRSGGRSSEFGSDFAGALGYAPMTAGAAAGAGVLALGAGIGYTVKKFAEFDATMSRVKALTGATNTDMKRLTDTAKQLGATTKYSAAEAAQAMTYLGMAGWDTNNIVSAMPGLLNLAAASGEDLAHVADIVSDDLTAFKMPAEQAGHFADVLAVASSKANTNVSMMGETFKYVGPIAGSLGYTIEDMALATGVMANSSIKGSEAGTALRSLITRMVKPTKESATAMQKLGITVKDANGKMKPFRQVLKQLRDGFSKLSDAEKAEYAAMLAGQEAMSGTLALANENQSTFDKLTGALDNANGKAKEMSDTMNANLVGAVKEMQSKLEGLALTFGQRFEGPVANFVKTINNGLTQAQSALNEFFAIAGGVKEDPNDPLMQFSGPDFYQAQQQAHPLMTKIVELSKVVSENAEKIAEGFNKIAEAAEKAFGNELVMEGLEKFLDMNIKAAEAFGKVLEFTGQATMNPLVAVFEAGKELATSIMETTKTAATDLFTAISEGTSNVASDIVKFFGEALSQAKQFFSDFASHAIQQLASVMKGLSNLEIESGRVRAVVEENAKAAQTAINNTANVTNNVTVNSASEAATYVSSNPVPTFYE